MTESCSTISTVDIEKRLLPEVETALRFGCDPEKWWDTTVRMEAEMYRINAWSKGHGGAVATAIYDVYSALPSCVDKQEFVTAIENVAAEFSDSSRQRVRHTPASGRNSSGGTSA